MSITPMKAIRHKCLDCCAESSIAVKTCPVIQCSLWKFRLGIHPFTEKNSKNPLLEPNNFKGKENMNAEEVLSTISKESDNNAI